jgi:Fe2+ transport system protein FeoA
MLRLDYSEVAETDGVNIVEIVINTDDPRIFERARRLVKMIMAPESELTVIQPKPKKD